MVADLAGSPVRVYSWVDLLGPDLMLDPELVGAAVARIYRVAPSATGPVGRQRAAGGVCVIDRDECGPASRDQELACVLFESARSDPGRARAALVSAYEAADGPARVTRRGDFSMLVAQLGHIVELGCRDWLTPHERSPSGADAEAWVRETLDDPHTRARLDALLVAVG